MWCGFIIALSALGAFLWLGLTGHEVIAGVGIIADIATLAGIFVYGTQSRKQERLEQARMEAGQQEYPSDKET